MLSNGQMVHLEQGYLQPVTEEAQVLQQQQHDDVFTYSDHN